MIDEKSMLTASDLSRTRRTLLFRPIIGPFSHLGTESLVREMTAPRHLCSIPARLQLISKVVRGIFQIHKTPDGSSHRFLTVSSSDINGIIFAHDSRATVMLRKRRNRSIWSGVGSILAALIPLAWPCLMRQY